MSSDTYTVRVASLKGRDLRLHVLSSTGTDHAYTRSFVLGCLAEAPARKATALAKALDAQGYGFKEQWHRAHVGEFVESSSLEQRHNVLEEQELARLSNSLIQGSSSRSALLKASWKQLHWFEVSARVTDAKWVAHLKTGMTFGVAAFDVWFDDPASVYAWKPSGSAKKKAKAPKPAAKPAKAAKPGAKAPSGKALKLREVPGLWLSDVCNVRRILARGEELWFVADGSCFVLGMEGEVKKELELQTREGFSTLFFDGKKSYAVAGSTLYDVSGTSLRKRLTLSQEIEAAAGYEGRIVTLDDDSALVVYDDKGRKLWSQPAPSSHPFSKRQLVADAAGVVRDAMNGDKDGCLVGYDWKGKERFRVKAWAIVDLQRVAGGFLAMDKSGTLIRLGEDGKELARWQCVSKEKSFRKDDGDACGLSPDGRIFCSAGTRLFGFDLEGRLLFEAGTYNGVTLTSLCPVGERLLAVSDGRPLCLDVTDEGLSAAAEGRYPSPVLLKR